jgi:hypothetical protein
MIFIFVIVSGKVGVYVTVKKKKKTARTGYKPLGLEREGQDCPGCMGLQSIGSWIEMSVECDQDA